MKIGLQTNVWAEESHQTELSHILAEIAAAGYDGLEIGARRLLQWLDQPAAFRQMLHANGLTIVGLHIVPAPIHDAEAVQASLADWQRIIDFAAALEAPFIPLSNLHQPDKTEAAYPIEAESLNRLGQLCRRAGLALCYHNHFWEIENDCRELFYLRDHTDPALVSFCLDVGWVERVGASPVEVSRAMLDRIGYFHLKDTLADRWIEPGQGAVDFPALLRLIAPGDWWLVVERDEPLPRPAECARQSRRYLRQLGL